MQMQDFSKLVRIAKSSRQVHSNWYRDTYPDVATSGLDPAEHYLRYGAAMGRNPGRGFDTQFYLATYPDAAVSGMNPLVHYMMHGKAQGYAMKPPAHKDRDAVLSLRDKLLSLGFTDEPLRELETVFADSLDPVARSLAVRELILWHIRQKTEAGYRMALELINQAKSISPSVDFSRRLLVTELVCHHFLGNISEARAAYETAAKAGLSTPDALLAVANLQDTDEERMLWINLCLSSFGITSISLLPDDGRPLYDRLTGAEDLPEVTDGPLISVLIAAYEAADTLPTAIRSLQEQTWKNLEILVLDDCSPTMKMYEVAESFAAQDSRIRVIRLEENGGAYVARNRGMDEAKGKYVTLHDADDWSHPLKIETQVRFLEENLDIVGCTTQQARATEDLVFWRLNSDGKLLNLNTSSFMFRREEVKAACGYWDDVRFGADTELIKRMSSAFGKNCVKKLFNGPFSFQRISDSSIVGNPHFGIEGFHFGVRFIYHEAYREFHGDMPDPSYHTKTAPKFATPDVMKKNRRGVGTTRHYDVIIASDFRMAGGSTRSSIEEMLCHEKFGLSQAHFHMFRYDFKTDRTIFSVLSQSVDTSKLDVLGYGENATCDLLILRYPPILQNRQRYLPNITAGNIKVIVNQPPQSDYGPQGEIRYDLATCADNIRHYFGKDAVWHPIGPVVRDALHQHHAQDLHHIDLADSDWLNIIDIAGWDRGPRQRGPKDRLRIGRHSRDHEHKWPDTREGILAAYPARDDVEVHVLGGAGAPSRLIGNVPANWTVHAFGSMHPADFLAGIDVYVYFAHPDWIESFGRVIIEAMAVGVPVILPRVYEPLFKQSAIYATPETAVEIAQRLHADPAAYDRQVRIAQAYAQENFSYEMHVRRVSEFLKK